jgi:DNA-binding transcriptional regulator LsrR (DeoR family)
VDPIDALARAAGFYLDSLISEEDILGITAGRTMRRVISALALPTLIKKKSFSVVQLMGGFPSPSQYDPTTNVHEFTSRFGTRGYFFHLPLYAGSERAGVALRDHGIPESVLNMWKRCNIMINSVGVVGEDSVYRLGNLLSKSEMESLCSEGAVGDFLGRWFDLEGNFLDHEINNRVLAIPVELARKVDCKVLVAGGAEKRQALLGILDSGLVDILITDQRTSLGLSK